MLGKTSFRLVFGDSPVIKVIDFFLDNEEFDYSLTDIAKNADVGWTTLHQFWKEFLKLSIVVNTRKIGRAKLYKLNVKNELVQKLREINLIVSKQMIMKEIERQKLKA